MGIIPLDHEKFYVDDSTNPVTPFYRSTQICPFGQQIATENTSFLQFTPGFSPSNVFNISGIEECPKSDNCGDNTEGMVLTRNQRAWYKFTPTIMQLAESEYQKRELEADTEPKMTVGDNITFVSDYVATEESLLLINQGGHEDANGNFCCNHSQL